MPSIEDILTRKLCENDYGLWTKSWAAVVSRVFARAVLTSFDSCSGLFTRPLPPINDLSWRVRTIATSLDVAVLCEYELMAHFDILNRAVATGEDNSKRLYGKRTKTRMRRHLGLVNAR